MEKTNKKIELYGQLRKIINNISFLLLFIFSILYLLLGNTWLIICVGIFVVVGFISPIILSGLIEKEISSRHVDLQKLK